MSNANINRSYNPVSPLSYPSAGYRYPETFDFDLWASHVKRQMIACLRKRGAV